MNNAELIAAIKLPGKIEMPVLAGNDVVHLVVEKIDLIRALGGGPPNEPAPWAFYGERNGVRRLDVA